MTIVVVSRQRVPTTESRVNLAWVNPAWVNPAWGRRQAGRRASLAASGVGEHSGSAQIGALELVHAPTQFEGVIVKDAESGREPRPGKQAAAAG